MGRDLHNQRQLAYYGGAVKRNMVPTGSPYLRRHVKELLAFACASHGERIIEVGCGMGRYTLLMAEQGCNVTGLDLSPVLIDRLRGYNGGRYDIPLYCADILQPPAELHGSFDIAAGFFAMHHFHDIPKCLASMARLLKKNGRIVFLEPNAFNPLYYLQIMLKAGMTWEGDKGILKMRGGYVLRALSDAGFTSLESRRFGFFPPFVANHPFGASLEAVLESFPLWRPFLPFQLFRGVK